MPDAQAMPALRGVEWAEDRPLARDVARRLLEAHRWHAAASAAAMRAASVAEHISAVVADMAAVTGNFNPRKIL
jgi:hypothetical protein